MYKRLLLTLLCGLALSFEVALEAQTRTIQGLAFPIDEIVQLDQKNSRVSIQGRTFIVPHQDIDATVVKHYLSDKQSIQKLPASDLANFAEQSLQQVEGRYALEALHALLLHQKFSPEQWREFLPRIQSLPKTVPVVQQLVKQKKVWDGLNNSVRVILLFEIACNDAEWLKNNMFAAIVSLSGPLHEYAERGLSEIIRTRKFPKLSQLAELFRAAFGVEDRFFQETRLLADSLDGFRKVLESQDAGALEIVLVSLQKYEGQRKLLYPYFVDEIHRVVRESIDSNREVQALTLLSAIDLSFRTPTTHALATLCLERLRSDSISVLDRPGIKRFLLSLSQFDEQLKSLLQKRIVLQFRVALENRDIPQVDRCFESLLTIQPDPNQLNDQLRIAYAHALREWGYRAQSQAQIRAVRTGLPLLVRLDLLSGDAFGVSLFNLVSLLVSGGLLISLLIVRFSTIISQRVREKEHSPVDSGTRARTSDIAEDQEESFSTPGFRRMNKVSPERNEYVRCLEVFDLPLDANFKQIRHAYREEVKTHHPDRQGEGGVNDRFVYLNQTYERIIELRKIIGLEDE